LLVHLRFALRMHCKPSCLDPLAMFLIIFRALLLVGRLHYYLPPKDPKTNFLTAPLRSPGEFYASRTMDNSPLVNEHEAHTDNVEEVIYQDFEDGVGETPLTEYKNTMGEGCCGACSIRTKFSVTNKVKGHCFRK